MERKPSCLISVLGDYIAYWFSLSGYGGLGIVCTSGKSSLNRVHTTEQFRHPTIKGLPTNGSHICMCTTCFAKMTVACFTICKNSVIMKEKKNKTNVLLQYDYLPLFVV